MNRLIPPAQMAKTKEVMESIIVGHPMNKFVHIRQRQDAIRVRIPHVLKKRANERTFVLSDYETFDDALRDAKIYRNRKSAQVLRDREEYSLGVKNGAHKKRRWRKADEHGYVGSLNMRFGELYYEVQGIRKGRRYTRTFAVPREALNNLTEIEQLKKHALEAAKEMRNDKTTLLE